ncbi:uncharacterized protein FSUBG_1240 [Fusarium subglutinans]|uniref:RRM domain-containing protein n=1 Tax=Gibberella subglutinans TaxID=42677 RepID=A0A8H5V8R5_GIBSU|nr:uncharacterized protein FSUBG_1240 [Fusarium subglutinans]KAF5613010.1 hypothetical protein FSUBG_1240 [Fusarium subglutinans]
MAQPQPASAGDFSMSNGPSPPPQPNLDPDRTYARDQPPNLREAFTSFYPNGLPNCYKMLQTPGPGGVVQTYVEDYLPVGFYISPPVGAKAVFSTCNGSNPFRYMEHLLPQRRVHLWSGDEVQSACNSLRKLYWEVIKDMPHPDSWDSLWDYFDAQDIYNYGALNLWNVVSQLFVENQSIALDVHNAFSIEVGQWVDHWLYDGENRDKLIKSNETGLSINGVIGWEAMKGLPDDAIHLIASALEHRRSLLLSPEKLRPGAMKPNHLKEFYEKGHLENWLAGQRVLGPSGLSTRPTEWQPHYSSPASEKVAHPVMVLDGKHYFRGSECRVPSAVEALHQSAAAAGPSVHGNNDTTSIEQKHANDTTGHGGLRVKTQARSKSTEPFPSVRTPSPNTKGKGNDMGTASSSNGHQEQDEQEDFETPTRAKRHGRKNPRTTRGAQKSTVTASLPGSAVMRNSSLASPTKGVANTKQAEATSSRSKDHITGNIIRDVELRLSTNDRPKNQRPNRGYDEPGAHGQKEMKYPGTMGTFSQMQEPDAGFQNRAMSTEPPEDVRLSGQFAMQAPPMATFYSAETFSPATQGNYSLPPQQNFPTQNGFEHGFPSVQQSQPPQRGSFNGRGRNTSNSSRSDRFDSNDGRWSHQIQEKNNSGNAGLGRGGFHRGGCRKSRRGHNQRNATAPVAQPHTGPDFNQKRRDEAPWKDQWRRDEVTCQNVQDGLTIKDYVPCSCPTCDSRDRSVYIIVQGYQGITGPDMLARLKFGLAERYGHVEDVFPIASKEPGRFIARFANSSSVGEALTIGGGNMPEQGISVIFSPALRSKWTLLEQAPTRPLPGRVSGQNSTAPPFSPYPFGLSMPGNTTSTAAVPHMMPGVIHPAVVNPGQAHNNHFWQPNGGQRSVSGFVQPPACSIPSTTVQPGPGIQTLLPGQPTLDPRQIVPPSVQKAQENASPPEILQTKPPSEEALDEIHHLDQDDPGSPRSDISKYTGIKARVSLPSTPSKNSLSSQGTPTKPNETAEGLAGIDAAAQNQNEMPIKALESPVVTQMTSGHQAEQLSESTGSKSNHSRAPSLFSKNEIKERKRAWAKIPMPLTLHGPRSVTPMNPVSIAIECGSSSGVEKSDNREPNAKQLQLPISGQNPISAPSISDVYEPSMLENPESRFLLPQAPKSSSAAHSTRSPKEDATEPQGITLDETKPSEMPATSPVTDNVVSRVEQSIEQEHTSGMLPRGKGKNAKKAKKKKAKNTAPTSNESSHAFQQNEPPSSPRPSYMVPQHMHRNSGGLGSNTHHGGHIGSQESGSSSLIKRHHDEPEQPSVSGSAKRSKKHGNKHEMAQHQHQPQPQPPYDESDSPDEDERGRRGFRMGRGGSLRFGKQRRPRPMIPSSMLAGEQFGAQAPPPSTDFAFQCQSLPESEDSLNLHDHGNGARSRLNPEAQEFVSPSRTASLSKVPVANCSGGEVPSSGTVNESAVKHDQTDELIREVPKTGHDDACETSLQDEKLPSAATSQTPKRRRAISEALQKGTPRKEKGPTHQGEGKKTPAKSSKRGKGKERAVTVSAKADKADKAEVKVEKAQEMPQTPENQGGKVKKPGLIDDDWPSLPASRERAQSKPQTPLIWGGKTKSTQDDGGLGQGSPVTKN